MALPNQTGSAESGFHSTAKPLLPERSSGIRGYVFAVVSVALALGPALFLQRHNFSHGELALFLLAVALTSWYMGVGPAILAILLSSLCFIYFFALPVEGFAYSVADVPAIAMLVGFAVLITRFSFVRHRIEGELRQARDELQLDIDNRKKAEERLLRSETYLAEAQRLSNTGSWAWNPVTREPLYWSEEMYRIYGLEPRDGPPPAEAFWQRIHPEDRDSMREALLNAASEKTQYEHNHRIILLDGTVKCIHAVGYPQLDAAGEVTEYIGTLVDVTERKQAEQARLELEEQWRAAFESNPTMYFIVDAAGDIVSVNAFGAEQLGYAVSELVGRPVLSVFYEPDKDAVQKHAKECFEQPGRMMRWEARKIRKDGAMLWVRETANVVVLKKRPVLLVACENITEQKRAEEARKQTQEALSRSESYLAEAQRLTHTGSWAWDPVADKVLYWSEEMFRIFGFDPEEDIPTGPEFGQRVHPEDHNKVEEYVRNSVRDKTDYLVNHRVVNPDGTMRYVETIGHPIFNASGEVAEYVGTAVDITDRKLAEEERERLRQLEADLAHMNRVSMMGELAASLAHEVKQPIAAAATNAKTSQRWLQREVPNIDEAREALSRIVKDVNRAADIIDRNRALYRRDKPKQETLDLNDLVREMTVLLSDAANRHSVSIRAELDGAVPAITADRVQMQQVLMNLMLNSIEAMKESGGELTIALKKNEDGQVQLSVSDSGVGLPVENTERLFDAFFTTKAQGTGMGLSISRRIVESHGGRLWASANPAKGATFHFTLPAAPETSSHSAA